MQYYEMFGEVCIETINSGVNLDYSSVFIGVANIGPSTALLL
jgi:hypothetical protein